MSRIHSSNSLRHLWSSLLCSHDLDCGEDRRCAVRVQPPGGSRQRQEGTQATHTHSPTHHSFVSVVCSLCLSVCLHTFIVSFVHQVSLSDVCGDWWMTLVPQASMAAKLKGNALQFHSLIMKEEGAALYASLVTQIQNTVSGHSFSHRPARPLVGWGAVGVQGTAAYLYVCVCVLPSGGGNGEGDQGQDRHSSGRRLWSAISHTHTHTHTRTFVCVYISALFCLSVCVGVCVRLQAIVRP